MLAFFLSTLFAPLVSFGQSGLVLLGMLLWGIGLGAQASLLKALLSQNTDTSQYFQMKIDLVGPKQRGLAMGFNEAAGYLALSGYLATTYALRPQPFFLGIAFALCGLLLSLLCVRESHAYAALGAAQTQTPQPEGEASGVPSFGAVFVRTSWKDRTLFAVSQAGLVNNLNDGLSWGLFPLYFAATGLDTEHIGWLVAAYPAVWGYWRSF